MARYGLIGQAGLKRLGVWRRTLGLPPLPIALDRIEEAVRDATETHVWGLRSDTDDGIRVMGRRLVGS